MTVNGPIQSLRMRWARTSESPDIPALQDEQRTAFIRPLDVLRLSEDGFNLFPQCGQLEELFIGQRRFGGAAPSQRVFLRPMPRSRSRATIKLLFWIFRSLIVGGFDRATTK